MTTATFQSHYLSQQSFFNGLLNEAKQEIDVKLLDTNTLVIPLSPNESIHLPLLYYSESGRHRYQGEITLHRKGKKTRITLIDAADLLITHYFEEVDAGKKARFLDRLMQSDDTMLRAQAHQKVIPAYSESLTLTERARRFIQSEQGLIGGHSMHPSPKSSEPLSEQEQRAYLPDFGQSFALKWFAVKANHVCGTYLNADLLEALKSFFVHTQGEEALSLLDENWVPFPMHPLQAKYWCHSKEALALNDVVVALDHEHAGWTATSSTRAIYHPHSPWMLKVSFPAKLTNSLRLLTENEVNRGIQLSKMLSTPAGIELRQRLSQVHIIEEPMWCGIKGINGNVVPLSIVSFRCNPYQVPNQTSHPDNVDTLDTPGGLTAVMEQAAKEQATTEQNDKGCYLLATANQVGYSNTQQHGAKPLTQVGRWVCRYAQTHQLSHEQAAKLWMAHFMENVIHPLCIARNDYGLVLLAHQQNVLLALKAGLPAGIALKDCQGVGLTDIAMQRFSEVFENEAPSYFMPTEQVNPYLAYYIFGNALTSTLANIAADCQLCENTLWAVCREKLQLWQGENPLDDSFYRFLLDSPYLKWKRNFYCFLSDLNESTLNDIDSIYCKIANPLQRQNSEASVAKTLPDGRTLLVQDMPPPTHTTVHLPPTKLTFELHYLGTSLATFECELAQLNAANEKIGQPDEHTYRQVGPKRAYLTQTRTLAALDTAAWWTAIEHTMFRLGVDEVCLSQLPEPVEHQILQDLNAFHAIAGFDTCSNTLLISRENVLMACPTWKQYDPLPVAQSSQQPKRVRAKNGIVHPVRPAKPNGVLFQRYLYSLGRTVRFRTLDIDRDLATFHAWHNHPQTADIWELAGSKSMHKDYLTRMQADPHQYPVIAEFDGVAFGYLELYWTPEDRLGPHYECQDYDRGMHILVGNQRFRGHVYFKAWAKAMLQFCFQDNALTQRLLGEPKATNTHVIAISERIGMVAQFAFDFPHKRAMLIQCNRDTFFSHFAI